MYFVSEKLNKLDDKMTYNQYRPIDGIKDMINKMIIKAIDKSEIIPTRMLVLDDKNLRSTKEFINAFPTVPVDVVEMCDTVHEAQNDVLMTNASLYKVTLHHNILSEHLLACSTNINVVYFDYFATFIGNIRERIHPCNDICTFLKHTTTDQCIMALNLSTRGSGRGPKYIINGIKAIFRKYKWKFEMRDIIPRYDKNRFFTVYELKK